MCQVQFISSSGLIRRNKPKQEGLMGPAANPETASSAHLNPKYSPCQGFQFSSAGVSWSCPCQLMLGKSQSGSSSQVLSISKGINVN